MNRYPRLRIDLSKIKQNTKTIVDLAQKADITVSGVTKATCGDPHVGQAMITGGVCSLADSRVENINRMKESTLETEFMLLRTPMKSQLNEIIQHVDVSLQSEYSVIKDLNEIAAKQHTSHRIILMVEMGDLREGMTTQELSALLPKINELKSIQLQGIGMNLACFGGVVPTEEKIKAFSNFVETIEDAYNVQFSLVSGGNSANIPLLLETRKKTRINHLRIGEGILLGRETVHRTPIPNTFQDAFTLEAELIELKTKPSVPNGKISENAFGETPTFTDKGMIKRGIVAIGRQDVIVEDLTPIDDHIEILGSSSDHIILHLKTERYEVGDIVQFSVKYGALVHLYTSPYVHKIYV